MTERRQAFAREPIEIDLGGSQGVISVGPVVWTRRNEFGSEVVRQNVQVVNEAVRLYTEPDTGLPQLEMKLSEKFSDGPRLLELGLDQATFKLLDIPTLHQNQITAILVAICEVNDLVQLLPMIDPNSTTPTTLGGFVGGLQEMMEPQKTESGVDSYLQESTAESFQNSPIQKSESSLTSLTEDSGMIETGV